MVSVILPTYNEAENIRNLIQGLCSNISNPLEVVVVDDNSSDFTWKIAQDLNYPQVRVIRRVNERGLATAIDRGIKESSGDIVGWMDADMSMPPSVIPNMLSALKDADIAIGSRYLAGG
ncbi:MAG: glycosyltransferase, partial [Nitrospirae bacterium]|nr:glycosyltransferase [Nitrospirota bacterium]